MKTVYQWLVLVAFFCSSSLFSQPINDDCTGAINLSINTSCTSEEYTSIGASDDGTTVAPNPSCGFYQGGDVWFTFDVPVSGNFRIDLSGNNWALYSGSCGNFTEILCDGNAVNFVRPDLSGETLYLRAYRFNSAAGNDFDLCVWEISPPVNDDCSNATALTVGTECTAEDFSTQFSTSESTTVAPDPSCGFFQGGDTWFTFEVPASGNFRVDITSSQWTLYTGSCGSLFEFDCQSGAINYREPSLAGQTLYLRAYRFNSSEGQDFSVCIWEYTPQPNDFCADAIELSVGSTCNLEAYSNTFSTAEDETIAPAPPCGFYKGGDTWFTFDAPESGDFRIEVPNTQWVLYSGTCGNFTEITCESDPLNISDPTLGGQTLFLRTFRFNSDQGQDFDICVWEIDVPENDDCANAIELNYSDTCIAQPFSSELSTNEDESIEGGSCGFYKGGDVWFKFDAPPSGKFTWQRTSGSQVFAFYTGSCGNFTEIDCGGDSEFVFDDPALGSETIYVRSYRFNSRQGSDYEYCLLTDEVPVNDNCSDALALPVGETCNFQDFNTYNATDEPAVAPDPSCGGYQGDDVWFNFQMPDNGKVNIRRVNEEGNFRYSVYTGTCGSFSQEVCVNNPSNTILDQASLAGQTIFLRVWRGGSTIGGDFELCLTEVDCNNTPEGSAFIDSCGVCVGGTTGLEACIQDCNGVYGGLAFTDSCGVCVGGNTGLEACVQDCNGVFGGDAFFDNCGECVGGNTGLEACVPDCNGEFGGTAFIDECGDCVGGNTGLEACIEDCNGVFGGDAFVDNCGTCVGGNTGLDPCLPDCNGVFGGSAFIDSCGTCVGGDTGLEPCCPVPFPALDENSLSTILNPTSVSVGWEAITGQVGCQVQLRFAGASSALGSAIVFGEDANSFVIPGNVLQLNQDYEWRVRCGCSQTPLIAGPFTSWQFFSTDLGASITANPNPTADITNVSFHSAGDDRAVVEVFNIQGAKVAQSYSGDISANQEYRFEFDTSGLPNGIYICRYTGQSKTAITKVMVAR